MQQLKNICLDLWSAGIDTSTHVISWGILYILHHPEVARRIREELDSKICGDRIVTLDDKHNLPYTNAVINVRKYIRYYYRVRSEW